MFKKANKESWFVSLSHFNLFQVLFLNKIYIHSIVFYIYDNKVYNNVFRHEGDLQLMSQVKTEKRKTKMMK